ncbi:dockerin type I repeat-containing protein [Dehalobacterium formicoaceticum]|uniref:dockerin type I repeat-containing protein n=1 Tax=Dehalobacterium formicoaceticum TaxID=51515 RepID=UPI0031F628DA
MGKLLCGKEKDIFLFFLLVLALTLSFSGSVLAKENSEPQLVNHIPAGTDINIHLNAGALKDAMSQNILGNSDNGILAQNHIKKCDVNGDGAVNIFDVVTIINFVQEKVLPTAAQKLAADANDDGVINIFDVVHAVNVVIGKIPEDTPPNGDLYKDYGVVTEVVKKNIISDEIEQIKVLSESGEEAIFSLDTDKVKLLYQSLPGGRADLKVDDFIKFSVNDRNEIDGLKILATICDEVIAAPNVNDADLSDYIDEDSMKFICQIEDSNKNNSRIKVDGFWRTFTDETIIFNGYYSKGTDSDNPEAIVQEKGDFLRWAEDLDRALWAYVQLNDKGLYVEYVYIYEEIALETQHGLVLGKYMKNDDYWIDLNANGTIKSYELKNPGDWAENSLVGYSILNNILNVNHVLFEPDVFAEGADLYREEGSCGSIADNHYALVTDTDEEANAFEINNRWYYADNRTVIYDYSDWFAGGGNPRFSDDLQEIKRGDYVIFLNNNNNNRKLSNGVNLLIKMNNISEIPGTEYLSPDEDDPEEIPGTIYGVITEICNLNPDSRVITEIKVLNSEGTEAIYKIDTAKVKLIYPQEEGSNENDVNINDFIKFNVNEDNEINNLTILAQLDGHNIASPSTTGKSTNLGDYIDGNNEKYIVSLQDGNIDNKRIKVDGNWLNVKDDTVIFNSGEFIDDKAELIKAGDLIEWAKDLGAAASAYVEFKGTTVKYIYVNDDIPPVGAVDYVLVVDNYKKSGVPWVQIDVKGIAPNYEIKGTVPAEFAIYDYSIRSNKFIGKTIAFDPDEDFTCYEVVSVNKIDNAIEYRKADGTTAWINTDKDSIMYDYTDFYWDGDDPFYISGVRSISTGDQIWFEADTSDDNTEIINLLAVVTNFDR